VNLGELEPKTLLQECGNFIIISKRSCKGVIVNINVEMINIRVNFSLNFKINFYHILGRTGSQGEHIIN